MTRRRKVGLGFLVAFGVFLFLVVLGAIYSGADGGTEAPAPYRWDANLEDAKVIPADIPHEALESRVGELVVFSGLAEKDGSGIRVFVENENGKHDTIYVDTRVYSKEYGTLDYKMLKERPVKVHGFVTDEPRTWRGDMVILAKQVLLYGDWDYLDAVVEMRGYMREALCDNCILHTVEIYPSGDTHNSEDYLNGHRMGGSHDVVAFDIVFRGLSGVKMSDIMPHAKFDYDGAQYVTVPLNDHDRKYEYMPLLGEMTGKAKPIEDASARETWHGRCTNLDERAVKPDNVIRACFPVPTAVTEISEIGLFLDGGFLERNKYATIILNSECGGDAYCIGSWNVPKPSIPDGYRADPKSEPSMPYKLYRYAVEGGDFYDDVHAGYGDIIQQASAAGLKHWGDLNNMGFLRVPDPAHADFVIRMGGTGENAGILGITDMYGSVNTIGCLTDREGGECTITLFVEDALGASLGLHNHDTMAFVVAHEFGHLLGFPHHGSKLHLMYGSLDPSKKWYDDEEYGHVVPNIQIPDNKIIRGDSYGESFIQVPSRNDAYDSYW